MNIIFICSYPFGYLFTEFYFIHYLQFCPEGTSNFLTRVEFSFCPSIRLQLAEVIEDNLANIVQACFMKGDRTLAHRIFQLIVSISRYLISNKKYSNPPHLRNHPKGTVSLLKNDYPLTYKQLLRFKPKIKFLVF